MKLKNVKVGGVYEVKVDYLPCSYLFKGDLIKVLYIPTEELDEIKVSDTSGRVWYVYACDIKKVNWHKEDKYED